MSHCKIVNDTDFDEGEDARQIEVLNEVSEVGHADL